MAFPKTLFDISLEFVSFNIEAVENFHQFPDIVGEKIFKRFISLNSKTPILSARLAKIIGVFGKAYKELVLESVDLSNSLLIMNEYFDCFMELFYNISELCLCSCFLGDNHELFDHLHKFTSLKKLCLKNNCLRDEAVRKMSLPLRMFKKGAKSIEYLDLSENKFSDAITPWLSAFENLNYLEISEFNLKEKGIKILQERCFLTLVSCKSEMHPIKNKGWATTLIDKWRDDFTVRKEKRKLKKRSYFAEKRILAAEEKLSIYKTNQSLSKILIFKKSLPLTIKLQKEVLPPSESLSASTSSPVLTTSIQDIFQQYL